MGKNTRIYHKFEWWSIDDCRCDLCVRWRGKKRGCALEACCCMEERTEALRRGQCAAGGSAARKEAA